MKFKNQPVMIVKDDMNNTIRVSKNNAEYAHIRLQQEKTIIVNGWLQNKVVSTLIHGKTEELQASGIKKYKKLPGNIIIQESLEGKERDLKYAGNTGIVCCIDGQPIYRVTKYDATGTLEDTLIAHNNGQAIREANSASLEDLQNAKVSDSDESMVSDEDPVDERQIDLEDAIAAATEDALNNDDEEETVEENEEEIIDDVVSEQEEEVEAENNNVFTL